MPMYVDQNENQYEGNGAVHEPYSAPRLVLIVGSLWQSLVEYPRLIKNSICLVIDVSSEIESLLIHPSTRNSIQLQKSGRNFTIKSLAALYGSDEQRRAMRSMPNMSLEDGIGQVRGFGAMAVRGHGSL